MNIQQVPKNQEQQLEVERMRESAYVGELVVFRGIPRRGGNSARVTGKHLKFLISLQELCGLCILLNVEGFPRFVLKRKHDGSNLKYLSTRENFVLFLFLRDGFAFDWY